MNSTTLWDAAARAGGKVSAFVALIESLRSATRELPLPEIIDHVLEHSGLIAHYRKRDHGPKSAKRKSGWRT